MVCVGCDKSSRPLSMNNHDGVDCAADEPERSAHFARGYSTGFENEIVIFRLPVLLTVDFSLSNSHVQFAQLFSTSFDAYLCSSCLCAPSLSWGFVGGGLFDKSS